MSIETKLTSLQVEREALGGLIRNPKAFSEIEHFVVSEVFNDADKIHRVIYSVIADKLSSGKASSVDKVLLAQEIKNLGLYNKGEIDIFSYIESISFTQITSEATVEAFKELTKLKICRDLVSQSELAKKTVISMVSEPVDKILLEYDRLNNEKPNLYTKTSGYQNLSQGLEDFIEGIKPADENKFLYGPFPTINRLYGPLHRPGSIIVVGARTSVGKTSFGMFYNCHVAKQHNIPVLHLDEGEMTPEELQLRMACMFTEGKVPQFAIENGSFKSNSHYYKLIKEGYAKSKLINVYYEQVSGLAPKEVIALIRRYSLNKFGRGNPFIVNFDYLKPFQTDNFDVPEWKQMGHFIQDIKSFVTSEIQVPFWTSLQLNRQGITTNKNSSQVQDDEGTFGISDRIMQQSTYSILLRNKLMDEIAAENNEFGNLKALFLKHRFLGKDYNLALQPVKVADKKYIKNYVNLNNHSFFFEDKSDLRLMVESLKRQHTITDNKTDGELI